MITRVQVALVGLTLGIGLSGCTHSQPSRSQIEQACLTACRQVIPDTVEVSVSQIQLSQLADGRCQVTARVAERRREDRIWNGLAKPITIIFAKRVADWSPTEHDMMGTKGVLQQDGR
jgi:hypothetical protein